MAEAKQCVWSGTSIVDEWRCGLYPCHILRAIAGANVDFASAFSIGFDQAHPWYEVEIRIPVQSKPLLILLDLVHLSPCVNVGEVDDDVCEAQHVCQVHRPHAILHRPPYGASIVRQ